MFALLVGIVVSCGSLTDSEVNCEEAVSHLENCCSKVDARRFTCERGCEGTIDLTEKASTCLQDRSCNELQDRGICAGLTRIANEPYPSAVPDAIEREACK